MKRHRLFKDRTGKRYGSLVALRLIGSKTFKSGQKHFIWLCKCDCGKQSKVQGANLHNRHTTSCGCVGDRITKNGERHLIHGYARKGKVSKTYRVWRHMIERCDDVKSKNYGGRGIKVCDRWRNFQNFLDDMGEAPATKTLERKKVNGNYEPSNCRWATWKEQANNTRRNRKLTLNGETKKRPTMGG